MKIRQLLVITWRWPTPWLTLNHSLTFIAFRGNTSDGFGFLVLMTKHISQHEMYQTLSEECTLEFKSHPP